MSSLSSIRSTTSRIDDPPFGLVASAALWAFHHVAAVAAAAVVSAAITVASGAVNTAIMPAPTCRHG